MMLKLLIKCGGGGDAVVDGLGLGGRELALDRGDLILRTPRITTKFDAREGGRARVLYISEPSLKLPHWSG